MSIFEILWVAVCLSLDALAVAMCTGASGFASTLRDRTRLAFHFGFFQAAMPVFGWLAGVTIAQFITAIDDWLAFLLLSLVAVRMIRSGLTSDPGVPTCDPTRGTTLIMLSLATSIDALAVGFSMALLGVSIWWPALIIGIVTFSLSYLAAKVGGQVNSQYGSRLEIAGGVVVELIGLHILLQHLLPVG